MQYIEIFAIHVERPDRAHAHYCENVDKVPGNQRKTRAHKDPVPSLENSAPLQGLTLGPVPGFWGGYFNFKALFIWSRVPDTTLPPDITGELTFH